MPSESEGRLNRAMAPDTTAIMAAVSSICGRNFMRLLVASIKREYGTLSAMLSTSNMRCRFLTDLRRRTYNNDSEQALAYTGVLARLLVPMHDQVRCLFLLKILER